MLFHIPVGIFVQIFDCCSSFYSSGNEWKLMQVEDCCADVSNRIRLLFFNSDCFKMLFSFTSVETNPAAAYHRTQYKQFSIHRSIHMSQLRKTPSSSSWRTPGDPRPAGTHSPTRMSKCYPWMSSQSVVLGTCPEKDSHERFFLGFS